MELKNKHIVVAGLGKSGLAAARFCHRAGARVTVSDAGDTRKLQPALEILQGQGIAFEGGPHRPHTFAGADLVVLSPGISHTIEAVEAARQKGVAVWGELELASRYVDVPLVAVTGTNGKTTTCHWIAEMLKRSGKSVFLGGNVGTPLMDLVLSDRAVDVGVVEVSSFQLDTADAFHPRVAVWLNTAPDHLDRYADVASYARSKARLFRHLGSEDRAILNAEDRWACALAGDGAAPVWAFGDSVRNGCSRATCFGLQTRRLALSEPHGRLDLDFGRIRLPGRHNLENAYAAALAAFAAEASGEAVQRALDEFRGLSHRLQLVATFEDVSFFNDSKATNVAAVIRALESFDDPVVLILGGRNKGIDFGDLTDALQAKAKAIVAIGESREAIGNQFEGLLPVHREDTMILAVQKAFALARPRGIVLLAPACASFDMFDNYAHRGDVFCQSVQSLGQRMGCHVTP